MVYIKHRNKKDTTVYAHLSQIGVKAGDPVSQGQVIGEVGQTGVATGPHLHLEFRVNNEPVDPTEMLAEQREHVPVSPAAKAAFARLKTDMRTQLTAAGQIALSNFE